MQFSFLNDPVVEAIAKRARSVVARQPGSCLDAVAETLRVPRESLTRLLDPRERVIDTSLLIDVVAALVREFAIDPKWLLTGEYDGAVHRHALMLGEDRSSRGIRAIRELVYDEYRRLRHAKSLLEWPFTRRTGHAKP